MIPPHLVSPPRQAAQPGPVLARVVMSASAPAESGRGGRPSKQSESKDPRKIAEQLMPLILRRVREEREALGDLTDPFA